MSMTTCLISLREEAALAALPSANNATAYFDIVAADLRREIPKPRHEHDGTIRAFVLIQISALLIYSISNVEAFYELVVISPKSNLIFSSNLSMNRWGKYLHSISELNKSHV